MNFVSYSQLLFVLFKLWIGYDSKLDGATQGHMQGKIFFYFETRMAAYLVQFWTRQ